MSTIFSLVSSSNSFSLCVFILVLISARIDLKPELFTGINSSSSSFCLGIDNSWYFKHTKLSKSKIADCL